MRKRIVIYTLLVIGLGLYAGRVYHLRDAAWQKNHALTEAERTDRSLAGNYLAARFATGSDDLQSAAKFYGLAIKVAPETGKDMLQERALPTAIGGGDMPEGLRLAALLDLKKPTMNSQLGAMLLVVDGFKNNDKAKVASNLVLMREDGFGRLLLPLLDAWSKVLHNDTKGAIARLDALGVDYASVRPLANAQKALVNEVQGNMTEAEKYYTKSFDENLSLRAAWLIGQFYERQGNKDKAIAVYQRMAEKTPGSFLPLVAMKRLQKEGVAASGDKHNLQDGVAAALYDVASVLYQESSPRLAVLYAQMAYYLAPLDPFINMLLGDIFASSGSAANAEKFYAGVSTESDLSVLTQFRLAALHESLGKTDQAMQILQSLAETTAYRRQALNEMADIYRRQEDFAKAIPYYTQIIEVIDKPQAQDWPVFYARAICLERTDKWPQAEKDLQQALKLSPDQPEVLNYLAYSWADHGKNLPRALEMLQRALAGAPQDPYITDSVGWALYRLGHFDDAVKFLDIAVQSLADDATVNDHLGDAYWRTGRQLEAEFQWRRALKNASKKDLKLINALQKKIRDGLPPLPQEKK